MKSIKTITFALPIEMGREIQAIAEAEKRTVSELIWEAVRQYKAQRIFKSLSKKGKAVTKKKKLTAKDFGGPFED